MTGLALKQHIRSTCKLARESLKHDERFLANDSILDNFKGILPRVIRHFNNYDNNVYFFMASLIKQKIILSGYHPLNGEVDCLRLMNYAKSMSYNLSLSLPVVTSIKNSTMVFKKYNTSDDLKVLLLIVFGFQKNQYKSVYI